MKERPILFSTRMVQAILKNQKSQTRRIAKWKMRPGEEGLNLNFSGLEIGHYFTDVPTSGWVLRSRGAGGCWNDRTYPLHCPYGNVGDRLWVRETWAKSVEPENHEHAKAGFTYGTYPFGSSEE